MQPNEKWLQKVNMKNISNGGGKMTKHWVEQYKDVQLFDFKRSKYLVHYYFCSELGSLHFFEIATPIATFPKNVIATFLKKVIATATANFFL